MRHPRNFRHWLRSAQATSALCSGARARGLAAFASVRFRTCQWIEDEPSPDDACKCGRPVRGTGPWCAVHEVRVTRPVGPDKRDSE